jgi:glycosyltransferase involved in cell wall biosynthesis
MQINLDGNETKPRVVLFGPSLTTVSGVSTHVTMLIASDLALSFDLLHFQVGSEGRRENGFQKFARFVLSPLHLTFFLLWYRPAIVHLNTSLDQKAFWRDLVYLIIAKLLRRRVVNQVHGGPFPQDFFRGNRLLTWILKQALLNSDAVTVLSGAELAAYIAIDPRINVHLVPNAIIPSGLADQPRGFNRDKPLRLIYIGRLVAIKGLFEAIEALRILRAEGRSFTFSIAGSGSDEIRLKQEILQAGLTECVTFLGSIFGEEKNRLWLESDVFVFPSYSEGLPYSLLESMAAGCVPITTCVAAIPDVMQDGVHGLFVPIKDAIVLASAIARLDDNRDQLKRMAELSRKRIMEYYTVDRLAADFERIYRYAIH